MQRSQSAEEHAMNTRDVLHYSHQTVLAAIRDLPDPTWEIGGVCGKWSVRQIIAHLASFEQMLVEVLTGFLHDAPTPTLDRYRSDSGFNDNEVALREELSPAATLAEYVAAHEQAARLLDRIPLEMCQQLGTLPWYGNVYDLDDFIVYAFYGHAREHSAQIVHFRAQLHRQAVGPLQESTDSA